jgi:hypothetical protein
VISDNRGEWRCGVGYVQGGTDVVVERVKGATARKHEPIGRGAEGLCLVHVLGSCSCICLEFCGVMFLGNGYSIIAIYLTSG